MTIVVRMYLVIIIASNGQFAFILWTTNAHYPLARISWLTEELLACRERFCSSFGMLACFEHFTILFALHCCVSLIFHCYAPLLRFISFAGLLEHSQFTGFCVSLGPSGPRRFMVFMTLGRGSLDWARPFSSKATTRPSFYMKNFFFEL